MVKKEDIWENFGRLISSMFAGAILAKLIVILAKLQETERGDLLISQAIMSISTFIAGPLLYWYIFEKKTIRHFLTGEQRYVQFLLLTAGLSLVAVVVNTFFGYWNSQFKFPSWLAGLEPWAKALHEAVQKPINLLTVVFSWKDLLMGLIIIAGLPAIGEELLFRGILQPLIARKTHDIHVAIWGSALVFSAIHLQIYSFLPRLLVGALFGYLYAWTQNLVYPIVAHFLNNSFGLFLLFMMQHTSYQFLRQKFLPIPFLFICTLIGTILIVLIYKQTRYLHPEQPINSQGKRSKKIKRKNYRNFR